MKLSVPITKIVSGGQTGVDRASFDLAREWNIPYGGWVPKGRWAEDGTIDAAYENLKETTTQVPEERTELNARDSDGTVILCFGPLSGGTKYTEDMALKYHKPVIIFDLDAGCDRTAFISWATKHNIKQLNVAGPRESHAPGRVYAESKAALETLLAA